MPLSLFYCNDVFDDPSINPFSTCTCNLHVCRMKGNANNLSVYHIKKDVLTLMQSQQ